MAELQSAGDDDDADEMDELNNLLENKEEEEKKVLTAADIFAAINTGGDDELEMDEFQSMFDLLDLNLTEVRGAPSRAVHSSQRACALTRVRRRVAAGATESKGAALCILRRRLLRPDLGEGVHAGLGSAEGAVPRGVGGQRGRVQTADRDHVPLSRRGARPAHRLCAHGPRRMEVRGTAHPECALRLYGLVRPML
jgi:hypothetical protein